jgi:AcrR family transcriptional regulator
MIACMSKQKTASNQLEEQQETRARIIAAAYKVLAEKGYEATTLREISREAQAAPGLVHYYFGGKDQLLVEVLQAAGRRFTRATEQLAQQRSADQFIEAALTQPLARVYQEPEWYRLRYELFSLGLHNPTIAPGMRDLLVQGRRDVGKAVARAETSMPIEATTLAAILLAVFDGLALQKIIDPDFDIEASYQLLTRMLDCLLHDGS